MLHAFVDESEHSQSGWFCMAGYAFAPSMEKRFNKEWRRLFGDRDLHMKDSVHGHRHWSESDESEKAQLLRRASSIIERTAETGIAVWATQAQVERAMQRVSTRVEGFATAYALCHHVVMQELGDWSRTSRNSEGIDYVFDGGYTKTGRRNNFLQVARSCRPIMNHYACSSVTASSRQNAPALQAADFLAWECVKALRDRGRRPYRDSFHHLVLNRKHDYILRGLDTARLSVFLAGMESAVLSQ